MSPNITLMDAYRMGRRAQRGTGDWDTREARFSSRYCTHRADEWCQLETAWANGWDDGQEGNSSRKPEVSP